MYYVHGIQRLTLWVIIVLLLPGDHLGASKFASEI